MELKGTPIEEEAAMIVGEYLEEEMIPEQAVESVTTLLKNDQPIEALETAQNARQNS
ncbi:hypothetical protein HYG81_15085 [Natrinema zhouii]|uniref:Uncharacterized protein n=1 Tax=Natrinema zhouii TaxID=1710539 RepID=A0A7D6CMX7_9EURY|nr:hypothetical protein [Natrinema zhouii]QLK25397.1 hypothetical protein HYG81_15085 [Natrinema zhouii]